uniref:DUF4795 domain-containing protein n=1 Tax=Anopheles atroparvus TaxID=41427 RepID=A0AAG5DK44_ANOAO
MEASLTFSELLAEAIGSPEPGALNFTALQQLLQAIVRKLDIENEAVDAPHEQPAPEQEKDESRSGKESTENETVDQPQRYASREQPAPEEEKDENQPKEGGSIERFEESEAYQQLLVSVSELREVVEELKSQVLEQKRISDVVLPTIEQLEQFHSQRSSSLHPANENSPDFLSIATRLDTIDETIGRLTALANDTVLEYSRMEKSLQPYLDGGELAIIRGQLDNVNQLLKVHFPGFRSHCSSISVLRPSRPSTVNEVVPVDFYQHPAPNSLKASMPRRSTITHQPAPDVGKELDTIRAVLTSLIARLPLPESESDTSVAASNNSLELAATSIRAVWPREIEELLHSNDERITALESAQAKHDRRVDEIEKRATAFDETIERLSMGLESCRESIADRTRTLEEMFEKKVNHLDERCSREQLETTARISELEHQVENRVDFEHFRTRLPRETFHQAIEELHRQMDVRVEQFMGDLHLIWSQLDATSTGMQGKCDKDELERMESRLRRRLTYVQLMVKNIEGTIRHNVEAAGTKVRLGPDTLRCVSCNHEATMQALAELVPTGKAFQTVEKEREQRIKQLNKLASTIALQQTVNGTTDTGKPKKKATVKANMVPPKDLAYKVHIKKRL